MIRATLWRWRDRFTFASTTGIVRWKTQDVTDLHVVVDDEDAGAWRVRCVVGVIHACDFLT